MDKQEKYEEDLLRQYIGPGKIENAPEGFTSKIMEHILLETKTLSVPERSWKKNLVPLISVAVTALLIASAFLIPHTHNDSLINPVLNLIRNIKFSMPEFKASSLFRLSLPSVTIYVFIGIVILSVFDRALYGLFHRAK
jgi:hypothetical protein